MKLRFLPLVTAAVLAFAAASMSVHAQTTQLAIMGSSAQYQEMGQADFTQKGCIFIDANKSWNIKDVRGTAPNNVNITDTAAAWVAWTPAGGSCSSPGTGSVIDFFMNTDSVLGNRCFFASPSCAVSTSASSFTCATAFPDTTCTVLPSSIETAINASGSGTHINVASTDIRPEDALFATDRALTPCGQPIVAGSQYLGFGQQTTDANQANPITGAAWTVNGFTMLGGSFNIANFAISGNDPASGAAIANGTGNGWVVVALGATPELVFVNPSNGAGLGSLAVTNINRATLAGFVDGTFGAVSDIIPQSFSTSPAEVPVNVIVREPVSGTYNTFEYAIPNSLENQTSQEVGLAAAAAHTAGASFPPYYCTGATVTNSNVSGPTWAGQAAPFNPLQETDSHSNVTSTRSRAIGTGNMVKTVENVKDSLGYAFWSQSNFSSASATNAKYLTVDGVDPIQEVWQDGEIPTKGNDLLSNVSFSHVKDGSYPIWSILRNVTDSSHASLLTTLVTSEQTFVTPDYPDFVLKDQLSVVRSHFSPPGITYPGNGGSPCNGDAGAAEAGGDVAGMVYSQQADNDYAADNLSSCGEVGHRQ